VKPGGVSPIGPPARRIRSKSKIANAIGEWSWPRGDWRRYVLAGWYPLARAFRADTRWSPSLKLYATAEDNQAATAVAPGGAADLGDRVGATWAYDVAVRPSQVRNRSSLKPRLFASDYYGRHSGIDSPARHRPSAAIVMNCDSPIGGEPEPGMAPFDSCTCDRRARSFATRGSKPRCITTDAPSFSAPNARVPAPANSYGAPPARLWLSRDPIQENGGLNLYGMVGNNPIRYVDSLGLEFYDTGYYPHGQDEPPPQPVDAYRCCDDATRAEGLKILTDRFSRASSELHRRGIEPKGEGDIDSCKTTSFYILLSMQPIPKCWTCRLERRQLFAPFVNIDHQVITCTSRSPSGGAIEQKIFDYWGGGKGSQDPARFRMKYYIPRTPEYPLENPITDTCDRKPNLVPADPFMDWDTSLRPRQ
jgi:hypothetical protein